MTSTDSMQKEKIKKIYVDRGFGFNVRLLNVPMIKIRGGWTPKIDYNLLADSVLDILSKKSSRLSGNEIRFIRLHFGMTLQQFATRFSVSHVAVIKWEKMKDRVTCMNWATEKDLRLFVHASINPKPAKLMSLYKDLEIRKHGSDSTIAVDLDLLAA